MTPLEFAYERFGRHVAPEATTAWLYKPGLLLKDSKKRKAGARSAGMGGTVIWIGESGVRVYGPDYRDRGFAAQGDSGQGKAFVRSMCLQVPEETWMAVVFGKPGADPERLTLNARGAAVTAYYDTKEGVLTFQPKVLRAAAAVLGALSVAEAMDALRIAAAKRACSLYARPLDPADLARLEKLRAKCPDAERAAGTYLRAGTMRPGVLGAYLKEMRHAA
ncbi:MAG: hypothetical protein ACYCV6_01830 [Steroidobacteraceae bacterium]